MSGFRLEPVFLLLAAMSAVLAGGCNVIRVTMNTSLTTEDVAFIVPGETTLAEVTDKLGSPDSMTEVSSGFVAVYRFLDARYSRVNFGWLVKPWSPVDPDLVLSRTGLGTEALEVLYDSKGIVTQHGFHRHLAGSHFNPYPF